MSSLLVRSVGTRVPVTVNASALARRMIATSFDQAPPLLDWSHARASKALPVCHGLLLHCPTTTSAVAHTYTCSGDRSIHGGHLSSTLDHPTTLILAAPIMAAPRRKRKVSSSRLPVPFTMKKCSSPTLMVLMLALAAGAFAILILPSSVLQRRDGKALIIVNLQDEAALAVRTDDRSLAGFANRSGHWHAFPGHGHLLRASTTLPFGGSYRDLIGGLANLPGLPLGRAPAEHATRVLSGYDAAATGDDDHDALKRALATVTVTTCEAQRLRPIREAVEKGWESGEARVAAEHLPYIEHWDTICYEVIRAHRRGVWDGPFTELLKETTNIHSKEEALAVVDVLVNRTMAELLQAHARRP
ncbi:hypothetical protein ACP70R_009177 [Stipagrostis hirtigluma subsp. patula]